MSVQKKQPNEILIFYRLEAVMNKDDHSKARASLPLTEAVLRETEIFPERHHVKRPVSSRTARFDVRVESENEPPVVTTRPQW